VIGEGASARLAIAAFYVVFIFFILLIDFVFDDNCLEINGLLLYPLENK
tara:strand:+ start:1184 stop:1330 length:147 start_codon:yes stop_codon:yes gene_type:complete